MEGETAQQASPDLAERQGWAIIGGLSAAIGFFLWWSLRTGADNLNLLVPLSVGLRLPGAAATALLILIPANGLWRYAGSALLRACAGAWQAAALVMLWQGLAYLGPMENDQLTAALNIGLLAAAAWRLGGGRWRLDAGTGWGAALAALCALPWLAWGALGSPLDTALNLAVGLLWGRVAAGLGAGATLTILAAAVRTDYFVLQMLLMLAAAPLGWAAARWAKDEERWRGLPWLLGLAAAAPLMLVDAEELFRRGHWLQGVIPDWATLAAWTGAGLAAAGIAAAAVLGRTRWVGGGPARQGLRGRVAAAALWTLGAAVYLALGQPGFHGERLLVVMPPTADLSAAAGLPASARRPFVYAALTHTALESQAAARAFLDRWGVAYTPHYLVNGLEVEGDAWLGWVLRARFGATRALVVTRDRPGPFAPAARLEVGTAGPPEATPENLRLIQADRVWTELGVTGKGVVVAALDGGVEWDHPALRPNFRGREGDFAYAWFDPLEHTRAPSAAGAHGTHALAVAVGQGVGVAPGAEWFFCRLGRTLPERVGCLEFELAPFPPGGDPFTDGDPVRGADVSTNSWECGSCDATVLQPAAAALRAAGVFVVAAAGNSGPNCGTVANPLANQDEVLTVGAVQPGGALAAWSSRGPIWTDGSGRLKPDLVAPGVLVLSATPGGAYEHFTGTSFAAPHVAGVVALMWEANSVLRGDVARTEAILLETAWPVAGDGCGGEGRAGNDSGYGLVDAYAAVRAALRYPAD
jgi:subtilisin family serine protease